MGELYEKVVIIVEKDRVKKGEPEHQRPLSVHTISSRMLRHHLVWCIF